MRNGYSDVPGVSIPISRTKRIHNVLGKRAGQATEPVTANRSARNTTLSILIGRDRLGCLTGSLSKYVNVERIHSHIGLGLGLSNITS